MQSGHNQAQHTFPSNMFPLPQNGHFSIILYTSSIFQIGRVKISSHRPEVQSHPVNPHEGSSLSTQNHTLRRAQRHLLHPLHPGKLVNNLPINSTNSAGSESSHTFISTNASLFSIFTPPPYKLKLPT